MMPFAEANGRYLRWLGGLTALRRDDLAEKDRRMKSSFFAFFRGTCFRWAQLWPVLEPELARAPQVLAAGDAHVENFGTWRDDEGRLVWGFNDLDEAHVASYASDLVRLVASAIAAREDGALALKPRRAAEAVLAGYAAGLADGGAPFVLDSGAPWLRALAIDRLRDRASFWDEIGRLPRWTGAMPPAARRLLEATLPREATGLRWVRRRSGIGSLGRPRLTLLAQWQGGPIAREAKPVLPPSAAWALGRRLAPAQAALAARAIRALDPKLVIRSGWIARRLAPDAARLPLADMPRRRDEGALLQAMGRELANLHLGTPGASQAIRADLHGRDAGWLRQSARRITDALHDDWQAWRRRS
ncbi:MAG: DUF2252 family protein [Alphaproteobacteria bacterium]|nr:DUF2252 family protein [Alphaproteobacteria bacterium]